MSVQELEAEAKRHEAQASELRKQARDIHNAELKAKPVADRLVYAAYSRCPCGAGLAYDPCFEDENSVFVGPLSGCWDCSAIMLGVANPDVKHTAKLPFAFYEVLSEGQPAANGATTRPKGATHEVGNS
jgi:hypothetical protein